MRNRIARLNHLEQRTEQKRAEQKPAKEWVDPRWEFARWLWNHAPDCEPDSAEESHLIDVVLKIVERARPDTVQGEELAGWHYHPRARWAMPLPDDFRFPLALLEWLADPPENYCFLHACGRCGLDVPVLHDSTVVKAPEYPFPTCPACGGKTSAAANWRSDDAAKEHGY